MLKVLHTEASEGWGGQEIRIIQESVGMMKRGYRLAVAAPERSVILQKARAAGIDAYPLQFRKNNPFSVLEASRLIGRIKPDIINTHSSSDSWIAAIAAKFSGTKPKIIRTRHLSTPISRTLSSRLIYDVLPDFIITTGEEIRNTMISVNGFRAGKILSIPTGIDLARFDSDTVRPSLDGSGFNIGMISVLRSWKGHRYLIEAAPEILGSIPEASFFIAGDGPRYGRLKELIAQMALEDRVLMLGHRDDIPNLVASLDVLVHPSYANEGVPQSILQAFAMKKPVISSDIGAIKEVVHDGMTGLVVNPRDSGQIAKRVIDLYRNPHLRKQLGERGKNLVEKTYSLERMLDRVEALYMRACSAEEAVRK